MSYTVFGAPFRYVQGDGASEKIGEFVKPYGKNAVTVGGRSGLAATRSQREKSFGAACINDTELSFGGEASRNEVARIADFCRDKNADVLIASGGGKAIDAVKAAADELDIPAIIMPTIASNDAPCSALAVIYNEDGTFDCLLPLKRSPYAVIADTRIIANAPVRQLVSGMGDALATWYEAKVCFGSGALNNFGANISAAAMALAKLCRDTLYEFGVNAKKSCENKTPDEALERIVEANTLLSGLGFESGGVALAHSISESLGEIEATHNYTHGEKVAFGLVAHMLLADEPLEERVRAAQFCIDVGLPVTLGEIGIDCTDRSSLMLAANAAAAEGRPCHNFTFPVNAEIIYDVMLRADEFGKSMKKQNADR